MGRGVRRLFSIGHQRNSAIPRVDVGFGGFDPSPTRFLEYLSTVPPHRVDHRPGSARNPRGGLLHANGVPASSPGLPRSGYPGTGWTPQHATPTGLCRLGDRAATPLGLPRFAAFQPRVAPTSRGNPGLEDVAPLGPIRANAESCLAVRRLRRRRQTGPQTGQESKIRVV